MASRKTLLALLRDARKAGNKEPALLILEEKVKRCPKDVVHGYAHQVKYILG